MRDAYPFKNIDRDHSREGGPFVPRSFKYRGFLGKIHSNTFQVWEIRKKLKHTNSCPKLARIYLR